MGSSHQILTKLPEVLLTSLPPLDLPRPWNPSLSLSAQSSAKGLGAGVGSLLSLCPVTLSAASSALCCMGGVGGCSHCSIEKGGGRLHSPSFCLKPARLP